MAKKEEQQQEEQAPAAAAAAAQGNAVVLPSGVRRVDFIRNNYYGVPSDYTDPALFGERGKIRAAINQQYKDAGIAKEIPYQIVFQATKPSAKVPEGGKLPPKKVESAAPATTDGEGSGAK